MNLYNSDSISPNCLLTSNKNSIPFLQKALIKQRGHLFKSLSLYQKRRKKSILLKNILFLIGFLKEELKFTYHITVIGQ